MSESRDLNVGFTFIFYTIGRYTAICTFGHRKWEVVYLLFFHYQLHIIVMRNAYCMCALPSHQSSVGFTIQEKLQG